MSAYKCKRKCERNFRNLYINTVLATTTAWCTVTVYKVYNKTHRCNHACWLIWYVWYDYLNNKCMCCVFQFWWRLQEIIAVIKPDRSTPTPADMEPSSPPAPSSPTPTFRQATPAGRRCVWSALCVVMMIRRGASTKALGPSRRSSTGYSVTPAAGGCTTVCACVGCTTPTVFVCLSCP